jgi:hypothetical protein
MANDDPQEGRRLQVVATAASEPEADLIVQRLAEAGQRDRARDVLKTAEGISEEELARLSQQPSPATPPTEQGPSPEDDQASDAD